MAGCSECPSESATDRANEPVFRRVLWVALIANFVMFGVEMVASQLGDSMSLQADALDFFGDSANYAISLFVVGMALTARAKASLFKGATMALFGTWVLGSAVYRAIAGSAPDPSTMGAIAALALL
ncbi:MAG: cation transporter, partial [Woeseia sp.]|nr:cation transporter [Woeseia sp.]